MCLWYWQIFKSADFLKRLICRLPRFLLCFEEDFLILKPYFPVSSWIKSVLFSLFPFLRDIKAHCSFSHSFKHTHACCSFNAYSLFNVWTSLKASHLRTAKTLGSECIKLISGSIPISAANCTNYIAQNDTLREGVSEGELPILAMHLTQLNTGSYCAIYRNIAATDLRGFNIIFPHM